MRSIGISDFVNYKFLSNVKLSPSGDKLAYITTKADLSQMIINMNYMFIMKL